VDWQNTAGDVLLERRTAAGLTQRGLADLAGVSQAEIGRIETHRSQPTLPVLGRLLDVLGTELVPASVDDVRPTVAVEVAEDVREILRSGDTSPENLAECYRSASTIVDAAHRWSGSQFRRAISFAPGSTGSQKFDALIAALVEDCCTAGGVTPPPWVDDKARFVDGEWFPSGIDDLHEVARRESPEAFRRHGVFIVEEEFGRA
jgi:transcriptional regulator with XRE-family HTH domain